MAGTGDSGVMTTTTAVSTPEEVFARSPLGFATYTRLADELRGLEVEVRPTRSQIAFRRRRTFALLWDPQRYLHSRVPVVLSIALPYRISSTRVKEVVPTTARTWMHHLELDGPDDLDDEVLGWIRSAYAAAA